MLVVGVIGDTLGVAVGLGVVEVSIACGLRGCGGEDAVFGSGDASDIRSAVAARGGRRRRRGVATVEQGE